MNDSFAQFLITQSNTRFSLPLRWLKIYVSKIKYKINTLSKLQWKKKSSSTSSSHGLEDSVEKNVRDNILRAPLWLSAHCAERLSLLNAAYCTVSVWYI